MTKGTDTAELLHGRKICVVIPTYNNAGTISDVVTRTQTQCRDVIVVNDGSTDGTGELLKKTDGITLIENHKNQGKGTALKRGLQKAREMGFTYAITLDADGQHFPEDIPLLLECNLRNPGAIVIGNRKMDGIKRSGGSKFANAFGNFWFCVQTLHWLPDTQSGFRLYPLHKLHVLPLLTSRYEAELELLVSAAWNGVKIVSVPVNVYYPPQEERVTHFRPGPDFTRIFVLNTFLCALAFVWGYPFYVIRVADTIARTVFALMVYLLGVCILTPFSLFYVPASKLLGLSNTPLHMLLHASGKVITCLLQIAAGKVTVCNTQGEDFRKPAIIICNHQSHLDLMILLSLTRKIVFLTNNWVYNSPFFGYILRHAEYYPVSMGYDKLKPKIKDLTDRGYCIAVFPEGTRSEDCQIGRFHKGAFQLADDLKTDILPLVMYGAGRALPKHGKYMRRSPIVLHIEKRTSPQEFEKLGHTILERAKRFRRFYIHRLADISNENDD
ncbi:MAG: glycosyltransferase [Bacteroidaceae bacterium]|nr:glycosyltransferase [Bacteroidaceae bacterium]